MTDPAVPLILTGSPVENEEDCACSDSETSRVSGQSQAVQYCKAAEVYQAELPKGFRLVLGLASRVGPAALNSAAMEVFENFTQPRPLNSPIEHRLAEIGLLKPTGQAHMLSPVPAVLTAWLHITNACNLDCPYCYVRKSTASMTVETGQKAIAEVFKTAIDRQFKQVKLKYAGGEATLHFERIRQLHEFAAHLSSETGIGLKAVILSNGTRLRPIEVEWLKHSGVKLMISLDGMGEDHDRMRHFKNGRGSFQRIVKIIDEIILPAGISPTISITVTGGSALGAAGAVRWALNRNLPVSINFYRQTSQSGNRDHLAFEEETILAGMRAAFEEFEAYMPERSFINGMLDRVRFFAHTAVCGVGRSYIVISHEGKPAQCHMQLDAPIANNLDGDLLSLVEKGPLRNLVVDDKAGCRTCLYRYYCTGGCPLQTHRTIGRWDVPSPNCSIYRALIPAALRLEGLRIMKQNGLL